MENSRKPQRRNDRHELQPVLERALDEILARVFASVPAGSPAASTAAPIIAVAYSGGLDSSVLLHLMQKIAAARGVVLHALHVHHGLSPNADAWERHCRDQARKLDTPFSAARVQVSSSDPRGVEQAARVARYQQLGAMCRQLGAAVLLTAHHQNDQAETVLLQMMRGAGLPGLSGMPLLQQSSELLGNVTALARPLLGVPRAALERVARQLNLSYVEDESNADLRYRRNGMRHQVFPVLEAEFPGFSSRLTRVATHLQAAQRLLQDLAQIDLANCAIGDAKEHSCGALNVAELKKLSAERADNLLRHWLYRQGVDLPSTTRLDEIRWQMFGAAADMHPFFDFGPVQLRRVKNRLELQPAVHGVPTVEIVLNWHGQQTLDVPEWNGRLHFELNGGPGLAPDSLRAQSLLIRPRLGSERLKVGLNRPSRNLKQLFQERAIPSWQRPQLPLIYLGAQLVFVAGLGMDSRSAIMSPGVILRWQPTIGKVGAGIE